MAKSTHQGICQGCGRMQKLPNGKLSKHGYTVDNGWFNGVCMGSDHLPFEQSKDEIEGYIKSANESAKVTRSMIVKILANDDPNDVYYHGYDRLSYQYFWVKGKLSVDGHEVLITYTYRDKEINERNRDASKPYREELNDEEYLKVLAHHYNKRKTNEMERTAKAADEYAAWQEDRIKGWTPKELTKV